MILCVNPTVDGYEEIQVNNLQRLSFDQWNVSSACIEIRRIDQRRDGPTCTSSSSSSPAEDGPTRCRLTRHRQSPNSTTCSLHGIQVRVEERE